MADRRPFNGIKVLDLTRVIVGPYAAYQLALLGADVIKIEQPVTGDTMRNKRGHSPELGRRGMQTGFLAHNANKKSLTLNLHSVEGHEIFLRLAAGADVLIENFRGGSMERHGLGYEELHAQFPRLIYCSITGYGHTGPKRSDPAYDPVVQAASGMMSVTGTPETAPVKIGPSVVDYGTGFVSAFAIATALYDRERTGAGQHIDVSMLDTALSLMGSVLTDALTVGTVPKPGGNKSRHLDHYTNGSFECADGLISIAASEPHHREKLWVALGRTDIPADPRFTTPALAIKNISALHAEMERTLKTKTAVEWEAILNPAGVAAMRVRTVPEILAHEQVKSRNLLHTFDDVPGVEGKVTVPLVPFALSRAPASADTPPPQLGSDTAAILESIGYGADEVARLQRDGVV